MAERLSLPCRRNPLLTVTMGRGLLSSRMAGTLRRGLGDGSCGPWVRAVKRQDSTTSAPMNLSYDFQPFVASDEIAGAFLAGERRCGGGGRGRQGRYRRFSWECPRRRAFGRPNMGIGERR